MAFDVLNVGSSVNDGTGDTLRAGGVKINANFAKAVEGPATTPVAAGRVVSFDGTGGRLVQEGVGDGAVGTPSVSFASDLNTGMWRPAADTLAFSTGGAERLRVDSSGNVGIGTTTINAALTIGDGTSPAGVTPSEVFLTSQTSGASNAIIARKSADSGNAIITQIRSRGTSASPTAVQSGDGLGRNNWLGFDGTNYVNSTAITCQVDAAVSSGVVPGRILFATQGSGGGAPSERMRIDSSGNVGIGTNAPATPLHVNGTIRYTNRPAAGTITAMGWDTNGDLKASSSSARYKFDVQTYDKGLDVVNALRPVSFKFLTEERENIGFIAEEVDELGLAEVMLYDDAGRPEGVLYGNMVALLTRAVQELSAQVVALQGEVAGLSGAED